jgi:alkyl hydroperoxide reductase subunit AhpF
MEFADQLKADAVLVNKLKSLPNITIHVNVTDHRNHRRRRAR